MSASSKKQLRKEQNTAALTEKQLQEKKEAKKLKIYSITFAAVLALILCVALVVMTVQGINRSGISQKNTVALTVNDHELSNVDLNYFYIDAANKLYNDWYSQYEDQTAAYMQISLGLDIAKPLDEQMVDDESTWADYFMDVAIQDATSYYSIYDEAIANGYKLTEENQKTLDDNIKAIDDFSYLYGYKNGDQQLQAMYMFGADMESYRQYQTVITVAQGYINEYGQSLSYADDEIRDFEKDTTFNYNSSTFASYYIPYTSYASKVDSALAAADRIQKSLELAKADADSLLSATTVEELDKAIAALEINAEKKDVASTKYERSLGSAVVSNTNEEVAKWLAAEGRTEGEMTVIEAVNTSVDEAGKETSNVVGYYVIRFESTDNNAAHRLNNVRHILVRIVGSTTDENGKVTYKEEQRKIAEDKAKMMLETFMAGDRTAESFAQMAKENSSDTSTATNGGLLKHIGPDTTFVPEFLEWSIAEERQPGDTDIILTDHGYHVMYYDAVDEYNYRDYLITEDMREEDVQVWYDGILDSAKTVNGDTKHINTALTLAPAY